MKNKLIESEIRKMMNFIDYKVGMTITEQNENNYRTSLLNEQSGVKTIKGTTSPEQIVNPKVLTQYGLKANESNFKNFWELDGRPNTVKTFTEVKNLSLFTELTTPPNATLGDFIKFYVTPINSVKTFTEVKNLSLFTELTTPPNATLGDFIKFYVTPINSVNGERVGEDKIYELNGAGSITANIYDKKDDVTYIVSKIIGCQNGLLALARAMNTDKTNQMPNRVTIEMSAEERESSMISWNPSKVNNTQPVFNAIASLISAYIITKSKPNFESGDERFKDFINKNDVEISNEIVKLIKNSDSLFADEKYDRKKLGDIDIQPIQTYLAKLPKLEDYYFTKGKYNDRKYQAIYDNYKDNIVKYLLDEYKKRIKIYLDENFPENSESYMSQVEPKPYLPIGKGLEYHINGAEAGTPINVSSADKETNQGSYALGK